MPAALLLLPVALPAAGALLAWLAARYHLGTGRAMAALFAWGAVLALVVIWAPQRIPVDLDLGSLGAGIRAAVRIDAVTFAFGLFALVPSALLLTFQRGPAPALHLAAAALAMLTLEASGLMLAALAWGACLLTVALLVAAGGERTPDSSRVRNHGAWLALVWAAAAIYARGGTDQYVAVPGYALQPAVFALVALAAVIGSGLVPWKPWPVGYVARLRRETAGPAIAVLYFIGFYFLVRMYGAGGGHYPGRVFNLALSGLGAATAIGGALRAQAADSRRAYFAETLSLAGGFALLALALGTPLGLAAAIATLTTLALLVALLPLLDPDTLSGPAMLALVVAVGVPPTAVFGARLLDLQAAFEANEVTAFIGLAAAAAWAVGIAAAARATRLPAAAVASPPNSNSTGVIVIGVLLAVGGGALGVVQAAVAIPAASAVIEFPGSALTGTPLATAAGSGAWPAVGLGSIVAIAAVAIALAGRRRAVPAIAATAPPVPFFAPRWRALPDRLGTLVDAIELPAELRVTGWRAIDGAMTKGSVWLWVAVFLVLGLVISR
ncbi:MAG: hypothetical protein NVS9B1_20130 [Candidatus Dormibacteraceae bacterium]